MAEYDPALPESLCEDLGDEARSTVERALAETRALAEDWGVVLEGWLPGGTCSLVLTGRWQDREVVVRAPLLDWERDASLPTLRAFSSHGGVPVWLFDEASGTSVMPRLRPGTTLAEADEDEAVEACASLILRLRGAEGRAPTVAEYLAPILEAPTLPDALRPGLSDDAARLARSLLASSPAPQLLHGDLHHFNVLRHGDEWVAIDPEGLYGDPAYETTAFIRNPIPAIGEVPDLPGLMRRRILRFSERLGDAPERIWGWAMVRTAQCVCGDDPNEAWTKAVAALDRLWPEFSP